MSENRKCILCNYAAQLYGHGALEMQYTYACPNCGTFRVSSLFDHRFDGAHRHLLSGYVREHYEKGKEAYIDTENIESILDSPSIPHSPIEKLDKLLLWYYKQSDSFGKYIPVSPYPAICYAVDQRELESLYEQELGHRLIRQVEGGQLFNGQKIYLTMAGHDHCKKLANRPPVTTTAFIAMWFNEEVSIAYSAAIAPAIEQCGFRAVRIDNIEHNNDITDEIIAGIKESRFVVADLTGYRGGVYYEAGFARGLGIPVIFTCRKDWFDGESDSDGKPIKEKVHFDVNHLNIIVWETEEDLKKRIINRIRATIL